jgi:hypothetical protein
MESDSQLKSRYLAASKILGMFDSIQHSAQGIKGQVARVPGGSGQPAHALHELFTAKRSSLRDTST